MLDDDESDAGIAGHRTEKFFERVKSAGRSAYADDRKAFAGMGVSLAVGVEWFIHAGFLAVFMVFGGLYYTTLGEAVKNSGLIALELG